VNADICKDEALLGSQVWLALVNIVGCAKGYVAVSRSAYFARTDNLAERCNWCLEAVVLMYHER
jgi:hypothetical protein